MDTSTHSATTQDFPFTHYLVAAAYVAVITTVARSVFDIRLLGLTFILAISISVFLYYIRNKNSEASYLLVHVIVGSILGITSVSANQYTSTWEHYVLSSNFWMLLAASMSGWLYIVLATDIPKQKVVQHENIKILMYPLLVFNFALTPVMLQKVPSIEDTSCHYVLNENGTPNTPVVDLKINMRSTDETFRYLNASDIHSLLTELAVTHTLMPDRETKSKYPKNLSFCNETMVIKAAKIRRNGYFTIKIYTHNSAMNWQQLKDDLIKRIQQQWQNHLPTTTNYDK